EQQPGDSKRAEPPSRLSMSELFDRLSPAVPLVDAEGTGSGSGFLIRHKGKYLVVTNRHVVENARQGVTVQFPLGEDKRLTLPKDGPEVVLIRRLVDLAVVDVNRAAAEIEKLGIKPVRLAQPAERPRVGQHVFAIGHPGGGGGEVLTSTLSDGLVSAV